jgi:hypothetical protein
MSGGRKNPNRPKRRAKGRPPGAGRRTLQRADLARIADDAGLPPEAIIGGIDRRLIPPVTLPTRDRRRRIRETLDRLEQPRRLGAAPRDPQARQAVAYAIRRLSRAGDRLKAAHKRAGVPTALPVGDNFRTQRALAARSPDGADLALTWIRAEIDYFEHLTVAVWADRGAGTRTIAESWQFPAVLDPEIELRLGSLRALASEIEGRQRGSLLPEYDRDKLEALDRAIGDQVARVRLSNEQKRRRDRADVSLRRVISLALTDAPHIPPLARDLAGDQYEQLVAERVERTFATETET